jgi:hypothetical protein
MASPIQHYREPTPCPPSIHPWLPYMATIHGYHQNKFMPGLWYHVTRPIQFTLVVDDVGLQYVGKEHAQHLIDALETDYTLSKGWTGGIYCGITLNGIVKTNMWTFICMATSKMPFIKSAPHAQVFTICHTRLESPGLWPTYPVCPASRSTPSGNLPRNHQHPRNCGHIPLKFPHRGSDPHCPLEHSSIMTVNGHISHYG